MEFHQQTIHLVQTGGVTIGEIRFRYGLWQFRARVDIDINGEHAAKIAQKIKEIEDNAGT